MVTLNALRDYWKNVSDAIVTLGSAALGKAMQVAGSDGAIARVLKTDTDGVLLSKLTGSNAVEGIADFQLNIQGVLLASGARNVSTSCAKQINKNARGLMIFVNVTAVSGSGGLLLKVRGYDPVSGAAGHINNDPVAITATGLYAFAYYPGATGAGTILKQSTSAPLPKEWDAYVYHQDGSSYTYSIGYTAIL